MTIKGIDISNWQNGLDISKLTEIDFVIAKATEGISYVDRTCDGFIQSAIKHNKLWGIYHFARENDATREAEHFYQSIKGYIGHGIPVLDYEVWGRNSDVAWCEKFIQKFYDLTGIWCMIYISASHCKDFRNSWIPEKCGLWVAGYPKNYTSWPDTTIPYNVNPWNFAAIWQFTSSLRLNGFSGNLDGDYAYMDANAWKKYTNAHDGQTQSPNYEQLADEVISGQWGNGADRKERLNKAYGAGTYDKVQAIVNQRLQGQKPDYEQLATEVIQGKWGNGWNRMNGLNSTFGNGTYEKVQEIVNRRLL